jgi:Domain of unknown function (DUF5127)
VGYPILCHGPRECQRLILSFVNQPSPIQVDGVSYTIAQDQTSRTDFLVNGALDNQVADTSFRPIQSDFPVFAISRDLGIILATQAPIVWAIGYTVDPAISYSDLSGAPPKKRRAYYKSQYGDDGSLVSYNSYRGASLLNIFGLDRRISKRLYPCFFKGPAIRSERIPGCCFGL